MTEHADELPAVSCSVSLSLAGRIATRFALWEELDRHLRLNAKVGCLTRDFITSADIGNPDARRGWALLALWSHYGDGYKGVCLRIGPRQAP